MIQHLNKLFVAIIVLSIFTYFQRPDFNLPLFAFVLLLWNDTYTKQKQRMWYLMAFSLLIDVIWIIYWAITWGSYNNREHSLGSFTIILSVLIFLLKLVVVILSFIKIEECNRAIAELPQNLKSIASGPQQ